MKRSLIAVGLTLSLFLIGSAKHTGAALFSSTPSDKLDAPINHTIDARGRTPAFAVGYILLDTGIPAGVVQVFPSCASQSGINLKVQPGKTVRQALDMLVEANPQYKWVLKDGLVILSPSAGTPAILKTKVRVFRWSGTDNYAPSVPLNELIRAPEIRRRFSELGLRPGVHSGPGTEAVDINPVQRTVTPIDISLKNLSLMDGFSAIIRAYGHGIWAYTENKCTQDGSTWFTIDSSWD